MTNLFVKNRLGWELLLAALLSILMGIGVYWIVSSAAIDIIDTRTHREAETVAELFQEYVSSNQIASTDKISLDAWTQDNRYLDLELYENDRIFYQFHGGRNNVYEDGHSEYLVWEDEFDIVFKDKTVQAVVYIYSGMKEYLAAEVLAAAFGALFAFVLLLLFVRGKARYIALLSDELKILESGNLNYAITIKGKDELMDLAQGIDDMRIAFIERQNSEEKARDANSELITAMSHDLRSPLTSLIGYLDILRLGKYEGDVQFNKFLEGAYKKTYQIKELSDKLFEYFLVYGENPEDTQLQVYDGQELMEQIVAESVFELRGDGYLVDYRPAEDSFILPANIDLLRRAFDNVFSNIRKYGDPDKKISVVWETSKDTLTINFTNYIDKRNMITESTGIGVKVCEMAMSIHGGRYQHWNSGDQYLSTMTLPLRG